VVAGAVGTGGGACGRRDYQFAYWYARRPWQEGASQDDQRAGASRLPQRRVY